MGYGAQTNSRPDQAFSDSTKQGSEYGRTLAPPTNPRMTVGVAQNEQSQLLAQAHQCVSVLEDRLRPVLSYPQGGATSGTDPSKDPVSVLEVLELQNAVLRNLILRIEDLGQRVEL